MLAESTASALADRSQHVAASLTALIGSLEDQS
jgi:hypothetical protein